MGSLGLPWVSVTLQPRGGAVVARLTGPLDVYTAGAFAASLAPARGRPLAIDLSGVTMLDSAGVGALRAQVEAAERTGRRVVIVCPAGWLRSTLAVATLEAPLPVVDDIGAARIEEAPVSGPPRARPRPAQPRYQGWRPGRESGRRALGAG